MLLDISLLDTRRTSFIPPLNVVRLLLQHDGFHVSGYLTPF